MGKKLRQVTDNIHETIYLSDLESELISTPYFFRLHDVYQSSTVYMTFPSNRTKRYEHSLGTMSLASRMLYSSVTNADGPCRRTLFEKLKQYGLEIAESALEARARQIYFTQCPDQVDNLFDQFGIASGELDNDFFAQCVQKALRKGEFQNFALDYYQYYPADGGSEKNSNIEDIFFYRCLLQALRIVALFHDVGHPPYSHIIEHTLKDLYTTLQTSQQHPDEWNTERVKKFKKALTPFFSENDDEAYKSNRLYAPASLSTAQPHERIGLSFLNLAIDEVVPAEIKKIIESSKDSTTKVANILYYIIVVEFAISILCEKNIVFKSFHSIVDGIIDADRLDYIVRDSKNSGVDWGTIPYERIVNSARLFYKEKSNLGDSLPEDKRPFVVAFPQKISDDIEDLLLVRYKIFARINFHHRCKKTAMALKESVRMIAIDFLKSKDSEECICGDIQNLWLPLHNSLGDGRIRIIKWNDSWLVSMLHTALVRVSVKEKLNRKCPKLKQNLEEILLNKKKYYSLLKRGSDNILFAKKVLIKAGLTEDRLIQIIAEEQNRYRTSDSVNTTDQNIASNPRSNALDAINRLSELVKSPYDLQVLCNYLFPQKDTAAYLERALLDSSKVNGVFIEVNNDKAKTGLPSHTEDLFDNIYLFNKSDCFSFDDSNSLVPQIKAVASSVPWLYIYYVPVEEKAVESGLGEELIELLTDKLSMKLHDSFKELFPNTQI